MNWLLATLLFFPSVSQATDYYDCENGVAWIHFEDGRSTQAYELGPSKVSFDKERSFNPDLRDVRFRGTGAQDLKSGEKTFTISVNGIPSTCTKLTNELNGAPLDISKTWIAPRDSFTKGYSEAVSQPVSLPLSQLDSRLSPWFSTEGASNLCAPTALAQGLLFLRHARAEHFSQLKWDDSAGDSVDPNLLISSLAETCHTDREDGTNAEDLFYCLVKIFHQSGYPHQNIKLIDKGTKKFEMNGYPKILSRNATIEDIREHLQAGYAAVAFLSNYEPRKGVKVSQLLGKWELVSKHAISLVGYRYNPAWKEKRLDLEVMDPAHLIPEAFPIDQITLIKGEELNLGAIGGHKDLFMNGRKFSQGKRITTLDSLLLFLPQ